MLRSIKSPLALITNIINHFQSTFIENCFPYCMLYGNLKIDFSNNGSVKKNPNMAFFIKKKEQQQNKKFDKMPQLFKKYFNIP